MWVKHTFVRMHAAGDKYEEVTSASFPSNVNCNLNDAILLRQRVREFLFSKCRNPRGLIIVPVTTI